MKRSVWIGATAALFLGGWLAGLHGQNTVWRSAALPPRPGATQSAATPGGGASIGRPLPVVTRVARPDNDAVLRPAYYRTESGSMVQPIATVPPPGAIIATSARSAPPVAPPAAYTSRPLIPTTPGPLPEH